MTGKVIPSIFFSPENKASVSSIDVLLFADDGRKDRPKHVE
jgi:hypothetical protein